MEYLTDTQFKEIRKALQKEFLTDSAEYADVVANAMKTTISDMIIEALRLYEQKHHEG